jgi:hypothetical protein
MNRTSLLKEERVEEYEDERENRRPSTIPSPSLS